MENTMKREPPQTSPENAKMPKRIEGGIPPDASTAPRCPFYPVTFLPYIGIGHDGKFGMIGWKCVWIKCRHCGFECNPDNYPAG